MYLIPEEVQLPPPEFTLPFVNTSVVVPAVTPAIAVQAMAMVLIRRNRTAVKPVEFVKDMS